MVKYYEVNYMYAIGVNDVNQACPYLSKYSIIFVSCAM